MAGLYGAVIGAIAGGVASGVGSYLNNQKLASAYKDYAKDIRNAANQYSGHNADVAMREAGSQKARQLNNLNMGTASSRPMTSNNSMQNALRGMNNVKMADSTVEGQNLGRSNKATELQGKYNAATAKAQQALNQAGINYQVNNQLMQTGMNAAGGLAQTYNQIKSDENVKESITNDCGDKIPTADAEDALRQIESIEYKYKDGTGLDQDKHVGVTAQSMENTAFGDTVSEDANGVKQLDKQKLLESVMAGIAALQKELDAYDARG